VASIDAPGGDDEEREEDGDEDNDDGFDSGAGVAVGLVGFFALCLRATPTPLSRDPVADVGLCRRLPPPVTRQRQVVL